MDDEFAVTCKNKKLWYSNTTGQLMESNTMPSVWQKAVINLHTDVQSDYKIMHYCPKRTRRDNKGLFRSKDELIAGWQSITINLPSTDTDYKVEILAVTISE
ncbi:unnamed protein product [Trichobilharzia regenti]|nr:unnamed protein product [Trichobilharzia regenti]